jgi:hypothetical protein
MDMPCDSGEMQRRGHLLRNRLCGSEHPPGPLRGLRQRLSEG